VSGVTGAILVNLTRVDPKIAHPRVASLRTAPAGAHLELVVGPLAVNPAVIRLVRAELPRLSVRVLGESYAVGRWVDALRNGNAPRRRTAARGSVVTGGGYDRRPRWRRVMLKSARLSHAT
jgi:hypothetical protein